MMVVVGQLYDVPEVRENPKAKECCRLPDNLKVAEVRGDLITYRCNTCNRRHFVLDADAGVIGLKGAEVG